MRRWMSGALLALLCACASLSAAARPFTVEDLLHQESRGAVAIDPGGRWLVIERRDRFDSAQRYDYNTMNSLALSRLQVIDLARPSAPRPLVTDDPGPGLVMGPFSPSGERLAVFRLHDHSWTLGVVTLATGAVRWFEISPQEVGRGRALQWLSDREFLMIQRTDGLPPVWMRLPWIMTDRLAAAWAASARGETARTVMGSGAYAGLRERAPPNRLLRIDALSGRQQVLATDEFFDLELSPDSARVALFSAGPDVQVRGNSPVRGAQGIETEVTRLSILDLATGQRAFPDVKADFLKQLLSWSPSGKFLLGLRRGSDGLWTHGDLVRIDVATGAMVTVGGDLRPWNRVNPVMVSTAWMGDDPVILGRLPSAATPRDDWYRLTALGPLNLTRTLPAPDSFVRAAEDDRLVLLAGRELWSVDGRGRNTRRLAGFATLVQTPPSSTTETRIQRGPQAGFWMALDEGHRRSLARLDLRAARRMLPLAADRGRLLAASEAAEVAVTSQHDAHGVERLWLLRRGRAPSVLLTLNPQLADTDAPEVRKIEHRDADGRPVVSWLLLPPGPTRAERPPLIVRPYLGEDRSEPPVDPSMELAFPQSLRLLVGHGYAVLVPSLGRPGGQLLEPAEGLGARILNAVEAAAQDPGVAGRFDAARVALLGYSFGGYTVMSTITQTARFKAAVSVDGISDFTAYWSSLGLPSQLMLDTGYATNWHTGAVESVQPTFQAPPWSARDRYVRNSPLYFADRIETPLLLLHGALDSVALHQSEAMFSALFRQGKDAQLVTYWGALHGVSTPGDVRDAWGRIFQFLDERLVADFKRAAPAAPGGNPGLGSASSGPSLRPAPPKESPSAAPPR